MIFPLFLCLFSVGVGTEICVVQLDCCRVANLVD